MTYQPSYNLPELSKKKAFEILKTPVNELQRSSDYYKAVFNLSRFPGNDTELLLLELIQSDSNHQSIKIAKRKAVEVLSIFKSYNSIPTILKCMDAEDPYLVESSIWSLLNLNYKSSELTDRIIYLLNDSKQNRRYLIKALAILKEDSVLPHLRKFYSDQFEPGIRGACISAIAQLDGDMKNIKELEGNLFLLNQNDRQCAVQDIVDARAINLLPSILKSPISPSFRIRALEAFSALSNYKEENKINVISQLDSLILDDPNNINFLHKYENNPKTDFLIDQLFGADFARCYLALSYLIKREPKEIFPYLKVNFERARKDYGAIYFFFILFRMLDDWDQNSLSLIRNLLVSMIESDWPDQMKFRSASIITLVDLYPEFSLQYISNWLNIEATPFWINRYATLLAIERSKLTMRTHDILENSKNDSNPFVRIKAKYIDCLFK